MMDFGIIKYIRNKLSLTKIRLKYVFKLLVRNIKLLNKTVRKYPTTIQLPITYKCNFNCVMCGMRKLIKNKDYTVPQLKDILSDKLFKNVISIGLNGGEPFLRNDLVKCVETMIESLPYLKSFNIISNGYFTYSIIEKLSKIKKMCAERQIAVNISFSIDGVEDMQDFMRGHKEAWNNVVKTIRMIRLKESTYCDSIGIICTVTKYNVYNLEEVEAWGKKNKIPIRYNIATVNMRIDNADMYVDFSIFSDEKARLIAQEFFYKKAIEEKSETYFGLFLYIREGVRYAYCPCQYNEWVTLVPNGNISYCATYSKELGSALNGSAYDIFNGNIDVLNEIRTLNCHTCSHYIDQLDARGLKLFYTELIKINSIMF